MKKLCVLTLAATLLTPNVFALGVEENTATEPEIIENISIPRELIKPPIH